MEDVKNKDLTGNMNNSMTYREAFELVKGIRANKGFRTGMLAGHVCRPLSRHISPWFIVKGVRPNTVTVFMIVFGIVGSVFFAFPYVWCKIIGYILWFLWFTMDLCDGEVAKSTKQFSKYGTEMDYMAHLIDHPLMNLAIWLTFLQMNVAPVFVVSLIAIISISMELIVRNLTAFRTFHRRLESTVTATAPQDKGWFKYLWGNTFLYPTLIVCFSWILVLDYALGIGFSWWLYLLWLSIFVFMNARDLLRTLKRFYKG